MPSEVVAATFHEHIKQLDADTFLRLCVDGEIAAFESANDPKRTFSPTFPHADLDQ